MASQRSLERSTWKGIAKRDLAARLKLRWSLESFMLDKKCPKVVQRYVLKKFVEEEFLRP